jgi:hypothetical protein
MAKRVRASAKPVRRIRPNRLETSRPSSPAAPAPATRIPEADAGDMPLRSSGHLTDDELRRAEQLEAEANAREKEAIADALRRRARGRAGDVGSATDVNAPLSVRMSHEYAYVARDVRRIVLTGGLMVAILAVLYVLVNVLGVITL